MHTHTHSHSHARQLVRLSVPPSPVTFLAEIPFCAALMTDSKSGALRYWTPLDPHQIRPLDTQEWKVLPPRRGFGEGCYSLLTKIVRSCFCGAGAPPRLCEWRPPEMEAKEDDEFVLSHCERISLRASSDSNSNSDSNFRHVLNAKRITALIKINKKN